MTQGPKVHNALDPQQTRQMLLRILPGWAMDYLAFRKATGVTAVYEPKPDPAAHSATQLILATYPPSQRRAA